MNKAATGAGWVLATPAPAPSDETNQLGAGLGAGLGSGHIAALAAAAEAARTRLERAGHAEVSETAAAPRTLRRFGLAELARHAYGLSPERLRGLVRARPEWPQGLIETPGSPPRFTLGEAAELRTCLEAEGRIPALPRRPAGLGAKTVAFANFKGGVGKTSTAAAMAMAATLDGYRVLVVDLDSQGSMTALLGGRVGDEWQTAFAAIARDFAREISAIGGAPDETLSRAATVTAADLVQKTHWPGLDLIGAELNLYWAEFQIPVWRMRHRAWALWDALARFLETEGLTEAYDLVILDTPPALGYLTINALAAADILMVPLGANFLDFAATGRFLDMIATTFASIESAEGQGAEGGGLAFEWDALRLLLTRYDPAQQADMAALIREAAGPALAAETQEATALVGQAGEGARAVYEADPRDFNRDTYLRGRETFDRTWGELRGLIGAAWAADLARATAEEATHGPA